MTESQLEGGMQDMMMDKDEMKVQKMRKDRFMGAMILAVILPTYGWMLVDPSDMINGRAYHVFHERTGFWILISWLAWLFALLEFTAGYCFLSTKNVGLFQCIENSRVIFSLIWAIVGIEWIWYPTYEKAEMKHGDDLKYRIATSMIWLRLLPLMCMGLGCLCCCTCCCFMSCMAMCCGKK